MGTVKDNIERPKNLYKAFTTILDGLQGEGRRIFKTQKSLE